MVGYLDRVSRGLRLPSGRVIAVGRSFMLRGVVSVLAIWIDRSQPFKAPMGTYAVLSVYLGFSLLVLIFTWNDWWLDAKLAGAAHTFDIAIFALLVLSSEGYTSPYFTFFMFVLLAAAIRWGWRETG